MIQSQLQYEGHVLDSNKAFRRGLSDQEVRRRSDGEFFVPLEIICDEEDMSLSPRTMSDVQFPSIRRTEQQGANIYPRTANRDYIDNLSEAATDGSDATNTEQLKTCVDFVWNLETEKAHLLSNSKLCHLAYVQYAQAVTGVFIDDYNK